MKADETLLGYLHHLGFEPDNSYLREALRTVIELLMEVEISSLVDAEYYERNDNRSTYRNGYRVRTWKTRIGRIPIRVPKLRQGTYTPALIDIDTEQKLLAFIEDAYIYGADAHKVQRLLQTLDLPQVSTSHIARIYEQLDHIISQARQKPLASTYPYLWLDALDFESQHQHYSVRQVAAIAIGVLDSGEYTVLDFEIGKHADDEALWEQILSRLSKRGLTGIRLVISDAYNGLRAALSQTFPDAKWQYSRTHYLREALTHVPQAEHTEFVDAISTIFIQPGQMSVNEELERVIRSLRQRWPKASAVLGANQDHLLAYTAFPSEHWSWIASTDALLRIKQSFTSHTYAVGVLMDIHLFDEQVEPENRDYFDPGELEWSIPYAQTPHIGNLVSMDEFELLPIY